MPNLEDAIELALRAHRGQTDRHGDAFILHPLRVMMRLDGEEEKIAGVLHDVVEKTPVSFEMLRAAGYSEDVLAALDGVTRRADESYEEFVARSAENPLAKRVKLADLEDHLDLRRAKGVSSEDAERMNRHIRAWRELRGV